MKRFLSILLASLLILGTMSLTVSADVEFGLNVAGARAGLTANPFAVAGRKVMFNIPTLADGQTVKYFNGETEVTAEAGLVTGTVSLTINEGNNYFTAKIYNGADLVRTSPVVNVYGVAKASDGTTYGYGSDTNASYETHKNTPVVDTSSLDATLKAALEADGRTNIINGLADQGLVNITMENDMQFVEFSQDAFWTGATPSNTVRLFYNYNKIVAFGFNTSGKFYTATGGGSKTTADNTGVSVPVNQWFNYKVDSYYATKTIDVYVNDVLIAKSFGKAATTLQIRNFGLANTMLYGNRRFINANATLTSNPTLALTASTETVGEVTVTKRTLPTGATVYIYKNGVKGEAVDFAGADTATLTLTGSGDTVVYAQAEYADGSVAFDINGANLKSAESTIAFPAGGGSEPAQLITGSIAEGITINRAALADSTDVIAVVAVTAAGVPTVQLSTESTVENTFAVTGAAKVFVWDWDTLAPLCAPIQ